MAYGFDPEKFDNLLEELGKQYKLFGPTRYCNLTATWTSI